jgi:hypothetical protein
MNNVEDQESDLRKKVAQIVLKFGSDWAAVARTYLAMGLSIGAVIALIEGFIDSYEREHAPTPADEEPAPPKF